MKKINFINDVPIKFDGKGFDEIVLDGDTISKTNSQNIFWSKKNNCYKNNATIVPSNAYTKWHKLNLNFIDNKLKNIDWEYPLIVHIHFVRASKRKFNYINLASSIIGFLVDIEYFSEGSATHINPMFSYEIDNKNPRCIIKVWEKSKEEMISLIRHISTENKKAPKKTFIKNILLVLKKIFNYKTIDDSNTKHLERKNDIDNSIGNKITPSDDLNKESHPRLIKKKNQEKWRYKEFLKNGIELIQKEDFHSAITEFSNAIKFAPKSSIIFYNRGLAYNRLKEYNLAIIDFSTVLELDSKNVKAYYNRGNTYSIRRDYKLAISDFSNALRLDPNCIEALIGRGSVFKAKNDFENALNDYNCVLKLNPQNVNVLYNRGVIFKEKGNTNLAIDDFSIALKLKPNNIELLYIRGVTYTEEENYKYAIKDLNKVIILDPNNDKLYHSRGLVYIETKEYNLAIKDLSKALELNPKHLVIYIHRSRIYDIINETKKSKEDINTYSRLKQVLMSTK